MTSPFSSRAALRCLVLALFVVFSLRVASADEPKEWLQLEVGGPCGCGIEVVLHNTHPERTIRAVVLADPGPDLGKLPSPGHYPKHRMFLLEPGGKTVLGCSCTRAKGTDLAQEATFTIVTATYP